MEKNVVIHGQTVNLLDTPGVIYKRNQWKRHGKKPRYIIYLASLAVYDQETAKLFRQSLECFAATLSDFDLQKVNVIVIMTKVDILHNKCRTSNFGDFVSTFKGRNDPREITAFCQKEFESLYAKFSQHRSLRVYAVDALDISATLEEIIQLVDSERN
jgi:GTPase Era involved in 16S rRNA processing